MEARGAGLGVAGEEARLGDEFPCTVHVCGQEVTPEAQLGRGAEGLVTGAPVNGPGAGSRGRVICSLNIFTEGLLCAGHCSRCWG